jgi:hypothetical protein
MVLRYNIIDLNYNSSIFSNFSSYRSIRISRSKTTFTWLSMVRGFKTSMMQTGNSIRIGYENFLSVRSRQNTSGQRNRELVDPFIPFLNNKLQEQLRRAVAGSWS